MDAHKAVFRSLREIFPQVDLRILKAVAIEHYKDIDSAVDFIVDEVIPSISGSVGTSSSHHDAHGMESSSSSGHGLHVGEVNGSVRSGESSVEYENGSNCRRNSNFKTPSAEEVVSDSQERMVGGLEERESPSYHAINKELNSSCHAVPEFKENRVCSTSGLDARYLNVHSESKLVHTDSEAGHGKYLLDECFAQSSVRENENDGIHINTQQLCELDSKETVSTADCTAQDHSLKFPSDYIESRDMGMKNVNNAFWSQFLAETSNSQVLSGILSSKKDAFESAQDLPMPDLGESFLGQPDGVLEHKDIKNAGSGYEKQQSRNVVENDDIFSSFKTDMLHDLNQLAPVNSSHSGHSVSVEFLEDSIADAKNYKNDLLPSLELVTTMIEDVEHLEEKAKVAKNECSAAGLGILTKVEELKQMLNHAEEANDMHAGEVFGEKSILATEAGELHSRLFRLSDERNIYLAIIEEIRKTLEERLAVAQQEIEAAGREKLEKEALAQTALSEQEIMMNAILEESRKLQQEAEENFKLKDFLVERGRIVDTLQGEMAVICEDVLLLKEIVDEGLPLSKLQRSTMSSLCSSSQSSLHKSESSSDRIIQTVESTEKHTVTKEASLEGEVLELDGNKRTDKDDHYHGDSADDGWQFC